MRNYELKEMYSAILNALQQIQRDLKRMQGRTATDRADSAVNRANEALRSIENTSASLERALKRRPVWEGGRIPVSSEASSAEVAGFVTGLLGLSADEAARVAKAVATRFGGV